MHGLLPAPGNCAGLGRNWFKPHLCRFVLRGSGRTWDQTLLHPL